MGGQEWLAVRWAAYLLYQIRHSEPLLKDDEEYFFLLHFG